jgi:hypothetical protein
MTYSLFEVADETTAEARVSTCYQNGFPDYPSTVYSNTPFIEAIRASSGPEIP